MQSRLVKKQNKVETCTTLFCFASAKMQKGYFVTPYATYPFYPDGFDTVCCFLKH